MKYFINVESSQVVEVEANSEVEAIEQLKKATYPHVAAKYEVVIECEQLPDGSYGVVNNDSVAAIERAIEESQSNEETK